MTNEELSKLTQAIYNIAQTEEDRQKLIGRMLMTGWAWEIPLNKPDAGVDTVEHYLYDELQKLRGSMI